MTRTDARRPEKVFITLGLLLEPIIMDKNEEIVRRWFSEVWNQGNVSTIDELLDANAVVDGLLPDQKHNGREKFKEFHKLLYSAFSDFNLTVDEVVSLGDRATGSWHGTVVHSGTFQDRVATGKPIKMCGSFELTIGQKSHLRYKTHRAVDDAHEIITAVDHHRCSRRRV